MTLLKLWENTEKKIMPGKQLIAVSVGIVAPIPKNIYKIIEIKNLI